MKKVIISFFALTAALSVKAQNVVDWNFNAKKISDKVYEIHLTPVVESPWHIYSQASPEGGACQQRSALIKIYW